MDASRRRGSRPHPREPTNPLADLFFGDTWRIFHEGMKRDLTTKDLKAPLLKDQSQTLGDRLEKQWQRQLEANGGLESGRTPSLFWAITRVFGAEYAMLGIIAFTHSMLRGVVQPILLGLLLDFFANPNLENKSIAFKHAGGIVASTAITTLLYSHYSLGTWQLGVRMRTACCSMLYRKALRLNQTALGGAPAGQIVNLLSNDVSRFEKVTLFLHYLWLSPLLTVISVWLMYREVGWPAFVGTFTVLCTLPLQTLMSKLTTKFRSKTAYRTDARIRLIDVLVSGIRAIKMYAWEKPFTSLISAARRKEISSLAITSYIRGLHMTFTLCTNRTAFFCTMVALALFHENLTSRKVFVLQSYFNSLSTAVAVNFGRSLTELAEVKVSIKRLQKFMMLQELTEEQNRRLSTFSFSSVRTSQTEDIISNNEDGGDDDDFAVLMSGVTAQWDTRKTTLDNVNVCVEKGNLVSVVGPIGSGKSSLLQAILGELPAVQGSVELHGSVSYACQEAWVFAATVRQNILFGLPFERPRYEAVVRACVLDRDLAQMPLGDLTMVGDQGISLSGGQRARLNLARAVYKEADIYLLDEPLAALDPYVAQELFEKCICKFLAKKTRILVTNHMHYVQRPDTFICMDQASAMTIRGDLKEISRAEEVSKARGSIAGDSDEEELVNQQVSPKGCRQEEDTSHWALNNSEKSSKGRIKGKSVYGEYICSGSNSCTNFALIFLFFSTQILVCATDYFVSLWTYQDELRTKRELALQVFNESTLEEEHWQNSSFPTESLEKLPEPFLSLDLSIIIYSSLIVSLFLLTIVRSFAFFKVSMRCSSRLHENMLQSIIQAKVHFFNTNPAGRILNRFSKDIGSMDEALPRTTINALQIIMQMMGSIALAMTANIYLPIPVLIMGVIFWYSTLVYLRTSNNLKRIEGITKSPVFTHFHATMRGLATIRAYGAQKVLCEEFDNHQDLHTAAWYTFMMTSTAFGFFLDSFVSIFIAFITFGSLLLEGKLSIVMGGHPGLAITQCMSLSGLLQWGVRQSAEVANNMMSVERVLEYSCIEPEPNLHGTIDAEWPVCGMIKFINVSVRYNETDPPGIRNLNITIHPGQKVGIVGRTGAGKSSLVAALFRLCWELDGRVLVDGVDTRDVPLRELRHRIAIIPQEPLLFAGSMRLNLDPFDAHNDAELLRVLDEVELRGVLNATQGLMTPVAEGGRNLSAGQRQLVCLARAILRKNKILVMDEATANVDQDTDALLQRTIRQKFGRCTVLTVAHRLDTVMDYDKILVVDAGQAVEFDHPYLLLQNEESHLYKMVYENSTSVTNRLFQKARDSYQRKWRR